MSKTGMNGKSDFEILSQLPESGCGLAGDVFAVVYTGRNRTRNVEDHEANLLKAAGRVGMLRVLSIVEENSTIGDRGRKRIVGMLKASAPHVTAWSAIIEGSSIWVSTTRAITAGIRLVARISFPFEVASTVEAGMTHLVQASGKPLPSSTLQLVESLRQSLHRPDS